MTTQQERKSDKKTSVLDTSNSNQQKGEVNPFQFKDNRPEVLVQQKIKEEIRNNDSHIKQLKISSEFDVTQLKVIQRISSIDANSLSPGDYIVPNRGNVITRQDRNGAVWIINLVHKSDPSRNVQIHIHHNPHSRMGMNVRWASGDSSPQPLNHAMSAWIGNTLGL